jgi:hypothetical protein
MPGSLVPEHRLSAVKLRAAPAAALWMTLTAPQFNLLRKYLSRVRCYKFSSRKARRLNWIIAPLLSGIRIPPSPPGCCRGL